MKFALFLLLGVCAFATNGSENNLTSHELANDKDILEIIQKELQKLDKKSGEAVEGLMNATYETVNNLTMDLRQIVISIYNKIAQIIIKVDEKCVQLSDKGEHFKACVDKYRPELNEVFAKSNEDIRKCQNNTGDYIEHIPVRIQKQVFPINEQIEQVRNIVYECSEPSKSISSVCCAVEKGDRLSKSIGDIINNAYNELKVAREEAANIVPEANERTQNAVNEAQQKSDAILNKINECIKSQQTNSLL